MHKHAVSLFPERRPLAAFLLTVWLTILAPATLSFAQTSHSAGWVTISVQDYQALRAKAYPREQDPEPPPIDATLTRVDYDLHVSGDIATGHANLTVDVLKDGWVRVPIPSRLLVRRATIEGKPLSLVPGSSNKDKTHLTALLPHAGRFVLLLDLDVPVNSSAGNESVELPATESGITRASLQLPQQGIDLQLAGGLLSERSEAAGETSFLAFAQGSSPLTFTWKKKTEDHRLSEPLRLRGSLAQLISLGEDSSVVSAEVNLAVTQGAAQEVTLSLPAEITVNQVSGAMIADWEMKPGVLSVSFLEPIESNVRFTISGELKVPHDGQINIPLLRLTGTERDTGGVAVEVLGAGEIQTKDVKSEGLEPADASDLGEMIAGRQSPSLVAYAYHSGDATTKRALSVNVVRYTQQAVLMAIIEEARYHVLATADGKLLVRAQYAIRNNQRNFVKITLPPNSILWNASVAGIPVRPGKSPDGSLLIPLQKSRGGEDAPPFATEILYLSKGTTWDEKGDMRLSLPAADLPISRTGLLFYYPPLYKVDAVPGAFRMQEYEDPISAVLNPSIAVENASGLIAGNAPAREEKTSEKDDAAQKLLDKYLATSANSRTGILPVAISFPEFGPSVFLVSELTGENQSPMAAFTFQRDKKAGSR